MDSMHLTVTTLQNSFDSREGWGLPLTRHDGHIYLQWDDIFNVLYSTADLRKLHRQFFHPSADKLFNLFKRARPEEADAETIQCLQDISSTCHPCQMKALKPITFTVGSPKDPDIIFNREVAMDIMYLHGLPVLHIVYMDTHFHAEIFLRSIYTDDVWNAILRSWAHVYGGFPESALDKKGSQLISQRFTELATHFGVQFRYVPIESHNSNGLVERYHDPIRRTTIRSD
jgi:hypothetical protein